MNREHHCSPNLSSEMPDAKTQNGDAVNKVDAGEELNIQVKIYFFGLIMITFTLNRMSQMLF